MTGSVGAGNSQVCHRPDSFTCGQHLTPAADAIGRKFGKNGVVEFSPRAAAELKSCHASYLAAVGADAIDLAKKQGLDVVSAEHVRTARRMQLSKDDGAGRKNATNVVGGVVLGAAVPQVVQFAIADEPIGRPAVLITVGLFVVGLLLLFYGLSPGRRA
ncbi:hypothetical protein [Phytohabitans kaempferiae]|uniref:Uncharacterized protein n=1 Tax=Phytohabitans kaempferiae TaxID=1620943 RepID=A0ABV6MEZ7_9ACTN